MVGGGELGTAASSDDAFGEGADGDASRSDSESSCGSFASSDGAGDVGDDGGLGNFFSKPKRKTRLKKQKDAGKPLALEADEEAEGLASNVSGGDRQEQAVEPSEAAAPVLGAFFDPPKRRARLAGRSSAVGLASGQVEDGGISRSSSSSSTLPLGRSARERLGSEAGEASASSSAARHAASRAAWKRRGLESSALEPPGSPSGAAAHADAEGAGATAEAAGRRNTVERRFSNADGRGEAGSARGRAATGMYRTVPRTALDSTRCHWLLPPESLLIRVDPETSEFLQRQWLALAGIKSREPSASRAQGREGRPRKRSYPARLHAGWLAQTLRPRGWLASIPEDEQRNLPMPTDLISEPDRGPQRPNAAAVQRLILRELGALGAL